MNRKHIIVTAFVTAIVMFLLTSAFYTKTYTGRVMYSAASESTVGKSYSKFLEIEAMLDEKYMGETDDEKMIENAFTSYVSTLGDPYTTYLDKDNFKDIQENLSGDYNGIGIEINIKDEKIHVAGVFPDSPADVAGIVAGDFIAMVNSVSYTPEQMNELIDVIKNTPPEDTIIITVERQGELIELKLRPETINLDYVTAEMLDDGMGYIRVETFGDDVDKEFEKELTQLKSNGLKSLIIDLRSNPGGVLDVVVKMTDLLVPEGVITTVREKDGTKDEYKSDKDELDVPMCVLINGSSASASEVMAGALRDFDKAVVIGEKSFGKGVVQGIYEFGDGTAMRITVAKYYTPSGECIHGKGIKPDIEVKLPEGEMPDFSKPVPDDAQIAKAIEILKQKQE